MVGKYAVIGVGRFGRAIAKALSEKGLEVIAIDNNEEKIEKIKDDVALAITLNSADKKALLAQNINEMEAVVLAIGENFEALLLTAVYLMEMKIPRIIARANDEQQQMILEKMGIKEVLSPEDEVGKVVAEKLAHPSIVSFLQLPDGYEVAEIKAPQGIVKRTVQDIDFSNKYKLNLITIKREFEVEREGKTVMEDHVVGVTNAQTVVYETDTILLFGTSKDIEKFIEINE